MLILRLLFSFHHDHIMVIVRLVLSPRRVLFFYFCRSDPLWFHIYLPATISPSAFTIMELRSYLFPLLHVPDMTMVEIA